MQGAAIAVGCSAVVPPKRKLHGNVCISFKKRGVFQFHQFHSLKVVDYLAFSAETALSSATI
jgi:hypothetical protein